MTLFIAILAGIGTFLITQFVAALVLALLSTTGQLMNLLIAHDPFKFVLRLLVWAACGWLGMIVYDLIA